jgi:hypothetical protein
MACKVSKKFKMAKIFKMAAKSIETSQTNRFIYYHEYHEKTFFEKIQNGRQINNGATH